MYKITIGADLASLQGANLAIKGEGKIEVTATQDGNDEWKAAEPVIKTLNAIDALASLISDENGEIVVYNMQGMLVMMSMDANDLNKLKPGMYVINGVKVYKR